MSPNTIPKDATLWPAGCFYYLSERSITQSNGRFYASFQMTPHSRRLFVTHELPTAARGHALEELLVWEQRCTYLHL